MKRRAILFLAVTFLPATPVAAMPNAFWIFGYTFPTRHAKLHHIDTATTGDAAQPVAAIAAPVGEGSPHRSTETSAPRPS